MANGITKWFKKPGLFSLQDLVDANDVVAECKNCVLEVTLKKKEEAKPKHISVKVN